MALHLALRASPLSSPGPTLSRSMLRELPKVLSIYDIDMPLPEATLKIKNLFTQNGHVKDERVKDLLVAKGYMELEEVRLQGGVPLVVLNKTSQQFPLTFRRP